MEKCWHRQLASRLLHLVVTAPTREVLLTYVVPKLTAFLGERGLQLSEAKTRIVHVDEASTSSASPCDATKAWS